MPLFNFQTVRLAAFISSTWNIHTKSLGYKIVPRGYNMDKFMSSVEKQSHCYGKRNFFSFFSLCDLNVVLILFSWSVSMPGFPWGKKHYGVHAFFWYLTLHLLQPIEKPTNSLVLIAVVAKQYLHVGHRQVLYNWVQITSHLWASAFSL